MSADQKKNHRFNSQDLLQSNKIKSYKSVEKIPKNQYIMQTEFFTNCFKSILDQVIKQQPNYAWSLIQLQKKNVLTGFKSYVKCQILSKGICFKFKVSFPFHFFISTPRYYTAIIFQLQQLNISLALSQKKQFQLKIEQQIKKEFERIIKNIQNQAQFRSQLWLQSVIKSVSRIIKSSSLQNKLPNKNEKLILNLISSKYIPYPAPATFSWNPLGNFCLNQNLLPSIRKSLIPDPFTFADALKSPKDRLYQIIQQGLPVKMMEQDSGAIFEWQQEQQIDFIILHRQKQWPNQPPLYASRKLQIKDTKKSSVLNEGQSVTLTYTQRVHSQKIKQIIERYFLGANQTATFSSTDKLKNYEVVNNNIMHYDEITYLMEKIYLSRQHSEEQILSPIYETIMHAELSHYDQFFEGDINQIKYFLIKEYIHSSILASQDSFLLNFKAIIVENQYFNVFLEKYFKALYKAIQQEPICSLKHLCQYNKFNQSKAEIIFIDLLKKYMKQNNDQKKQNNVNKLIIKNKRKLYPLLFEWILKPVEKNRFLINLFPILIVKDRQTTRLDLRQTKRIITANAKILKFIVRINQLVAKYEENKTELAQTNANQKLLSWPRRCFTVYCQNCKKPSKIYSLRDYQFVKICDGCKN